MPEIISSPLLHCHPFLEREIKEYRTPLHPSYFSLYTNRTCKQSLVRICQNTHGVIENKAGKSSDVRITHTCTNCVVTTVMKQKSTLLLVVYKHITKRCSQLAQVLLCRDCKTKLTQKMQHYQDRARGMYLLSNDGYRDKVRPQCSSNTDTVKSCPKIKQRNKRTQRGFLKDAEIFVRKLTGCSYRQVETPHEKAKCCVVERSVTGDGS